MPNSSGAPLDQYSLTVRISGNVEVYDADLEKGDIYIRLSVGDKFTIELTEVGRDPKNHKRGWNIGKLSKTLIQIEHDTFIKIYQGEKSRFRNNDGLLVRQQPLRNRQDPYNCYRLSGLNIQILKTEPDRIVSSG